MSMKDYTQESIRDKIAWRLWKNAKHIYAKPGASQQKVDATHAGKSMTSLARPKTSGKYYDLDERMLAMGIFIETLKKEHLKNDPDFAFMMDFYRAARDEFNSLNDDDKAMYIAKAQKRNTIEDKAVADYRVVKEKSCVDYHDNQELVRKAGIIYYNAVDAELLKNDGKMSVLIQTYSHALDNLEVIEPYLAEATVRQVDEVAEFLKNLDHWEK